MTATNTQGINDLERWLAEDVETGNRLARMKQTVSVLQQHGQTETQEYRAVTLAIQDLQEATA